MNKKKTGVSRSFAWLNATQFFGALNDNIFQMLVIFFLVFLLGGGKDQKATIMAISTVFFVTPFLLFSHAAGVLADKFSKRNIIVFAKFLELAVMLGGLVAVYLAGPFSQYILYAMIFLMCTQSAIFGPSKYGIIPELVGRDNLSKANSLLVGLSYLAIIFGTFLPSFVLDRLFPNNYLVLAGICVAVSIAGIFSSINIKRTEPVGDCKRKFTPWFFVDIYKTMKRVSADKELFLTIIGAAYFLYLGAFIKLNLLLYGQQHLGLSFEQSGYIFSVAALGIGGGAILAGRWSGRNIEFGLVPIGAIGLTLCCVSYSLIPKSISLALIITFFVGVSTGLFIVPLNSFIQYRSRKGELGEILGCQNFLSFLGVIIAAGVLKMLSSVFDLTASSSFLVVGVLTAVLAVWAIRTLPDFLVRFVVVVVTKLFYRIKVKGIDNIPVSDSALLVCNHVTWVDALLIAATQQRRIRFMMARDIYDGMWLKPILKLMRVIPISPNDPPREIVKSLKNARQALDDGYIVCIFAEGAITRNGNMHGFKPGLERIVKGTEYPIIPAHIGGAWGSIFSYRDGKLLSRWPRMIPYNISIIFGQPMPSSSTSGEVRTAVLELSVLGADFNEALSRSLPWLFVGKARSHWFKQAISDTTGKRLSFGKTLVSSLALAHEIEKIDPDSNVVGILFPASVAGALSNVAVSLLGRTSVNINFTASAKSIDSAIAQCEIKTVISSRAFLEKLKGFKVPEGTVFIEDLVEHITVFTKLKAFLAALLLPRALLLKKRKNAYDDLVTIIFSSGSTGDPKGVMLTHHNIISNVESLDMLVHTEKNDKICAVLPFFHSFGYTVTLWWPLIAGFSSYYHPSPIDGSKIAEMVREDKLTILLSTPTFLLAYIRRAKKEDFESLRAVVVGAEKLKKKLADAFFDKFGKVVLEGYGATELAPVASLNWLDVEIDGVKQIGHKEGSIGHPIPGVAAKVVDLETGVPLHEGEDGMLMIKGPNVMAGYLNNPDHTAKVIKDGWYETGDVAKIDRDGFIYLLDRVSRFSKIGGEMVPHIAVEDELLKNIGTINSVVSVTSAQDDKKGEQLMVLYTEEAGDLDSLMKIISESDLPNLWKPKKDNFIKVDSIPVLGTGKMDLKQVKEIAREFVENRPGMAQKVVNKLKNII